ncbi:MAG: UMP kinase [Candidatus Nanohaloarchaea archaeon]
MVEKVYSIGGSIVRENLDSIEELAGALQGEEQVLVVTGAGDLSQHQDALEGLANKGERDLVGVKATRLNAQTLLTAMDAYPEVPETPEEIQVAAESGRDVVMGGMVPGYSTDAVAATAAELLDAELYVATTVDGVYTEHPEDPEAEKLDRVSHDRLMQIVGGDYEPGSYELMDETAVKIAKRSGIPVRIFEGSLENLKNPEDAPGTDVVPE